MNRPQGAERRTVALPVVEGGKHWDLGPEEIGMAFAYQDLMMSVSPSQPNLGFCPTDTLPPTTGFCPEITAPPPTGLLFCPQDTMPTNGCPIPSAVLLEDTSVHGLTLLQQQLRLMLSQPAS
jgi:hypothetical protein